MRTVTATLVVAAALLIGGTPAVTGAAAGCAATTGPHAALVVDTGSRSTAYCVALDAPSVSGIHLIQLAADQHGLTYALGFGGQAVCRLLGIGPAGDDCFADYPRYWGYWHGDVDGWTWAPTGAGSAAIHSGDVDGWVWGAGNSGSTHPSPPRIGIDAICAATAPSSPPSSGPAPPTKTGGPAGSAPQTAAVGSPSPSSPSPRPARPSPTRASVTPSVTTPTPNVRIVAGGPPDPPAGSGIPPGVPLAIALAIAFAAAGVWRSRGRKDVRP